MKSSSISSTRVVFWIVALAVLLSAVTLWNQNARAQQDNEQVPQAADGENAEPDVAEADDANPEEAISKKAESLGMMVMRSGYFGVFFYVLLFIFSIVAFMVAMERLVNLRLGNVMPVTFVRSLRDLLARGEGSAENFRRLSETSRTPIAAILKAGVLRAGRPLPEVEKSMEDTAAREMASMRSRSRPLSVVGNIAPLVGLLGTVVGMIFAFGSASQAGLGSKGGEELANGIYLALMTTAGGLAIAIPSLLLASWYGAKAERYMREIDECLLETMPSFAQMENSITQTQTPREEVRKELAPAVSSS
ncbi:MAG: MotA/TolQ/ExbB proton channel family protein [Woeseiales bacterium]